MAFGFFSFQKTDIYSPPLSWASSSLSQNCHSEVSFLSPPIPIMSLTYPLLSDGRIRAVNRR